MFGSSASDLRCSRAREWVSLALDGELDEARRLQLASHLGDCAECRRHETVLVRGRSALQATMAEPSENFEWKVQLGIQRALRDRALESDRRPGLSWRPALASAAAVALLVVGVGSLWLPDHGARSGSGPMRSVPGASVLNPGLMVESETSPASPDLSGGVRGEVFEIDAMREGFGIRTVSRTVSDPRFRGDLYAPVRDGSAAWGVPSSGPAYGSFPGRPSLRSAGSLVEWQLQPNGSGGLNLRLRGGTFPAARTQAEAVAESTVTEPAPR